MVCVVEDWSLFSMSLFVCLFSRGKSKWWSVQSTGAVGKERTEGAPGIIVIGSMGLAHRTHAATTNNDISSRIIRNASHDKRPRSVHTGRTHTHTHIHTRTQCFTQ